MKNRCLAILIFVSLGIVPVARADQELENLIESASRAEIQASEAVEAAEAAPRFVGNLCYVLQFSQKNGVYPFSDEISERVLNLTLQPSLQKAIYTDPKMRTAVWDIAKFMARGAAAPFYDGDIAYALLAQSRFSKNMLHSAQFQTAVDACAGQLNVDRTLAFRRIVLDLERLDLVSSASLTVAPVLGIIATIGKISLRLGIVKKSVRRVHALVRLGARQPMTKELLAKGWGPVTVGSTLKHSSLALPVGLMALLVFSTAEQVQSSNQSSQKVLNSLVDLRAAHQGLVDEAMPVIQLLFKYISALRLQASEGLSAELTAEIQSYCTRAQYHAAKAKSLSNRVAEIEMYPERVKQMTQLARQGADIPKDELEDLVTLQYFYGVKLLEGHCR